MKAKTIPHSRLAFVLLAVLAVAAVVLLGTMQKDGNESVANRTAENAETKGDSAAPGLRHAKAAPPAHPAEDGEEDEPDSPPPLEVPVELREAIDLALKQFRLGDLEPGEARRILADLKRALEDVNPAVAAAAIVAFLDSGEDAGTGLPFAVGKAGSLRDASTLRTTLLDALGRSDPFEAVRYAQTIFDEARSADEWALAMRNVAWHKLDEDNTPELRGRMAEMLDNVDWLTHPSGGFMEAFDIAVYLGGMDQFANMASVIGMETDEEAVGVQHAAFMAIDRLLLNEREAAFNYLDVDPTLLSWSPGTRAALMARADVTDDTELRAVENYLARTDLTAEEVGEFFSLFPNRNYTESYRLASVSEPTMSMGEVAENDLATLDVVNDWVTEPRFAAHGEALAGLKGTLEEWARQIREN